MLTVNYSHSHAKDIHYTSDVTRLLRNLLQVASQPFHASLREADAVRYFRFCQTAQILDLKPTISEAV